jgi:hypothetical protein
MVYGGRYGGEGNSAGKGGVEEEIETDSHKYYSNKGL